MFEHGTLDALGPSVARFAFLRRRSSVKNPRDVDAGSEGPLSLASFRRASLMTRTLVTIASMLAAFSLFVGVLALAAVSATKAVFPEAEAEPLAAPTGAGEADVAPAKKPASTKAKKPASKAADKPESTKAPAKAPASKVSLKR